MIRVDRRLNSTDVMDALTYLFIQRGLPRFIKSDNGSEFIAQKVRDWIEPVSTYKVEDTSCGHCVAMIEETVKTADTAAYAAYDLRSKTFAITGAQNGALILRALRDAGYPAVQA